MRKQRIEYSTSLDALVAIAKRLSLFEHQYHWDSEEFFNLYSNGLIGDEEPFIDWANDYRHYLALRTEVTNLLSHVA